MPESLHHLTCLLTGGWSDGKIRVLRRAYGCNTLHGQQDPTDHVNDNEDDGDNKGNAIFKCAAGVIATVLRAFCN